jgi:uncharacterized protein HemY
VSVEVNGTTVGYTTVEVTGFVISLVTLLIVFSVLTAVIRTVFKLRGG